MGSKDNFLESILFCSSISGCWGLHPDCQAWQQVPLPTEPSGSPVSSFQPSALCQWSYPEYTHRKRSGRGPSRSMREERERAGRAESEQFRGPALLHLAVSPVPSAGSLSPLSSSHISATSARVYHAVSWNLGFLASKLELSMLTAQGVIGTNGDLGLALLIPARIAPW